MTTPAHVYLPPEALAEAAHVPGMYAYRALCAESDAVYQVYWVRLVREILALKQSFTHTLNDI